MPELLQWRSFSRCPVGHPLDHPGVCARLSGGLGDARRLVAHLNVNSRCNTRPCCLWEPFVGHQTPVQWLRRCKRPRYNTIYNMLLEDVDWAL